MRKITFTLIAFAFALPALSFGQGTAKRKLISQDRLETRASYTPIQLQQLSLEDPSLVKARPIANTSQQVPRGKTATVFPVELGRSSNAFTVLRPEQNQLWASDDLNYVSFIHRQDVTIWGGGGTENGKYRWDFSTDGGASFNNDIGALQTVFTNYGRYPNITQFSPTGSTDPFQAKVVYNGPTNKFPTPGWIGHVYGTSDVGLGSPATTEQYLFDTENTLLPGGLCEGRPGEFWSVETQWDGAAPMDSIRVMKGTWNSTTNDVDWVVHAKLDGDYDKSFDGSITSVGPNIAFSPDGNTGWICYLSNINNGANTNNQTVLPCFIKSTDGGATWGAPIEADLDAVSWVKDSLETLWVVIDTATGDTVPASSGLATTGFDYDLTVDGNGNPHCAVVIGSSPGGFSISSGLAMFIADVYSTDGGGAFTAKYISPVLTFRGSFGTVDPITVDNYVQVSRDASGQRIFYSWVDSDTAATTGNMNGIGFGVSDNLAPNLRIASTRVSDGFQTCPRLITDEDFTWEAAALTPTMSPISLTNGSTYNMPIACMQFLNGAPGDPCAFWYMGNDATIEESDYTDPQALILTWDNILTGCLSVGIEDDNLANDIVLHQSYPNPATNQAVIGFELPAAMNVEMELLNLYGQQVAVLASGEMGAGAHKITVDTEELAAGVYFYSLRTNDQVVTKRMVVGK